MHSTWLLALASVVVVSAVPLAGFALVSRQQRLMPALPYLVSLAVGAMLGSAFLELIPESFAQLGFGATAPALLLASFVGFFLLERFLWAHDHRLLRGSTPGGVRPFVLLNLIGDGVHNAIDGMVIAASYAASPALGLSTTIAVLLHEIPQELGDFGVLVYGGLPVRRAVLLNVASALAAIAGAVATLALESPDGRVTRLLLPVAAGSFIYIAAADLIPELQRKRPAESALAQVGLLLAGMGAALAPRLVAAG